MIVFDWFTS